MILGDKKIFLGDMVYVVYNFGDPMPMTTCTTPELAQKYARYLALLPETHPMYTADASIDEVPLLRELPPAWQCSGSSECASQIHIHGCFADDGNCDEPLEHLRLSGAFNDDEDRKIVWETLRKGPMMSPRESELALHALDRIFDREDGADD